MLHGLLYYRELHIHEAERIAEIDATHYIKNAWRSDPETGEYRLVEINWTDRELPNGFDWHLRHFRQTLERGGTAFGCFDGETLVGYATLEGHIFGQTQRYVLLDQLFVSNACRGKGIGKSLFAMCAARARSIGAEKIYLCAGSAENTIAFYRKLGCTAAVEPDRDLLAEDPRDIQLEYALKGAEHDS